MRLFFLKPRLVRSKVFQFSLITSVYWMAMAMVETVWAVYLGGILPSDSAVGMAISAFTAVGILAAFLAPEILAKMRDTEVFSLSLLGIGICYTVFAFTNELLLFLVAAMAVMVLESLRGSSLGILFRDESGDRRLDQNEGMLYTMTNIGYLLGPLAAGYLSEAMGIRSVFALVAIFVFITLVRFRQIGIKDVRHRTREKPMLQRLAEFAKRPELAKAYLLNCGVEPWWAIAYIFVPLMLISRGYDVGFISLLIFVMILPLVAFEYAAMKNVRRFGYGSYFAGGYGALAIISLAMFFSNDALSLVVLFFAAGVAIAFLEPTRELYFFRLVRRKEEENLYAPFMTAISVSYAVMSFTYALIAGAFGIGATFLTGALVLGAFALTGATAKKH